MAIFGNSGLRAGLVDPRSEEEQRRQLAAMFANTGSPGAALGPGGAVPGARHWDPNLPDFVVGDRPPEPVQPQPMSLPAPAQANQVNPDILKMIGPAPVRKNNTGRDIAATVLAAIGDAFAQQSGYRGHGIENLTKAWQDRRDTFKTQADQYRDRMRVAQLPGMSVREMAAYMADPKAWGGNMSRAATSPYDAATLNPGDTRFLGVDKGSVQAPTRGQQYAASLGLQQGTAPYNTAIRDQELGANGPTAFGNSQSLENLRALHRTGYETLRQRNRMTLRGAPTYRDANPPPPRMAPPRRTMPTATGPNGEKVMWNGRAWVSAR